MFAAMSVPAFALIAACSYDGPRPAVQAITISMDEYTIDVPDVLRAGLVEVRGLNAGALTHQAVFAELPTGVTADEYAETLLDDLGPSLIAATQHGRVQLVRPGREQTVTIALEPGRYVVWCALPGPEEGASHPATACGLNSRSREPSRVTSPTRPTCCRPMERSS